MLNEVVKKGQYWSWNGHVRDTDAIDDLEVWVRKMEVEARTLT